MVQTPWETVWKFLRKLKIGLLYDPANPVLGIITCQNPPIRENSNSKRHMHPYVHSITIHSSQNKETT